MAAVTFCGLIVTFCDLIVTFCGLYVNSKSAILPRKSDLHFRNYAVRKNEKDYGIARLR
mgnify:CR=1 FL=1